MILKQIKKFTKEYIRAGKKFKLPRDGEKNLFFLKKSLQIELMVFSDVLAVLFEELFCLKEKDVAHDLYCSKSAKVI